MKLKTKLIIISLSITLLIIIGITAYISYNIGYRKPKPDTAEIEALNRQILIADNRIELLEQGIETYKDAWEQSVIAYNEAFDSINYQIVNNNVDSQYNDVNTYIDFVPDSVYFNPEFIEETRVAITNYHYRDTANSYSLDLKIRYDYSTYSFEIEPSELSFDSVKPKRFAIGAYATYNGGAGNFGFLPFSWLQINTMLTVNRLTIDGTEHWIAIPYVGLQVSF